jgi:hypothetical protein
MDKKIIVLKLGLTRFSSCKIFSDPIFEGLPDNFPVE